MFMVKQKKGENIRFIFWYQLLKKKINLIVELNADYNAHSTSTNVLSLNLIMMKVEIFRIRRNLSVNRFNYKNKKPILRISKRNVCLQELG